MNVESRCKRILVNKLTNFKQEVELPSSLQGLVGHEERSLGAYFNPDGSISFFLTDIAVYAFDEKVKIYNRIALSDIIETTTLDWDHKTTAENLVLKDVRGNENIVKICGGEGNFRDLFKVMRFFMRVQEDLAQSR